METPYTQTQDECIIRLDGVHKYYHLGDFQVHALRGITLEIRSGEFVAVIDRKSVV